MAELGHIKTVRKLNDESIELDIKTGSGPVVTAQLLGMAGARFHPMAGDPVLFQRAGQEVHVSMISGGDTSTNPGETVVFSRSTDGDVSGYIHLKDSGQVDINGHLTVDP